MTSLLNESGLPAERVAFRVLDGNSERTLVTTYGYDAERALDDIGVDRLADMLNEGKLELVDFNNTTYYNLYV
jgi:hypothetical protein